LAFRSSEAQNFGMFKVKMSPIWRLFIVFLSKKWHFDQLANSFLVNRSLAFGYHITFRLFDKGVIETFGPVGLVSNMFQIGQKTSIAQTGYIYNQFLIVITITLLIGLSLGFSLLDFLPDSDNFALLSLCYWIAVIVLI
jgi:hypothetical protein